MLNSFSCTTTGNVVDILPSKAFIQISSANVTRCVEFFDGRDELLSYITTGNIVDTLPSKIFVQLSPASVKQCVDFFEGGAENIYFLDENGRYISKALQRKDCYLSDKVDWQSVLPLVSLDPVVFSLPLDEENDKPLQIAIDKAFAKNTEISELPIVGNDGHIVAVARLHKESSQALDRKKEMCVSSMAFKKNQEALESCAGFHMDFDQRPAIQGNQPQVESKMKSFLSQVESDLPIILEDAYDIEEITWMCDRLRGSDKFGSDNNLYLKYSSWPDFFKSMETLDWTEIARSGKVVFLFSDEQKQKYYPTSAKLGTPQPLQMDEIVEMVDSIQRGFCGSDFFNMILDSHPSLLTIGWHGLSLFTLLWKVFCQDKTVKEAVEHLRNPNGKEEKDLREVNLSHMLKYKYEERLPAFLEGLSVYLNPEEKYGLYDWFKAFYLSANAAVGRKFLQRITPAIFYDKHGMLQQKLIAYFNINSKEFADMENEVLSGFKYKRYIGAVRSPLGTLGCMNNALIKGGKKALGWRSSPLAALKVFANEKYSSGRGRGNYIKESDPTFPISCLVRFEDLKLYPRETTEKLCEFLRIPWSETCLHITTNGEDSGIVDGTAGFDTKPVYNMHPEHMSTLDYYRIELLNAKNFQVYGYKLKYYDGTKYTAEDLEKLFAIPFKVETQELDPKKWPGWPNQEEIKKFHEWILQRALDVMEHGEKDYSVDKDGKPLRLVEVLVPDLKPGQKLFEC